MCKSTFVYSAQNLQIFDNLQSLETHSKFLGMSKVFDRVWYECLIYKLNAIGVSKNLLTFFQSFLDKIYQRVELNGQNSHWELIKAGVSQGSILAPLLFLINVNLFDDDLSIFSIVNDINISTE